MKFRRLSTKIASMSYDIIAWLCLVLAVIMVILGVIEGCSSQIEYGTIEYLHSGLLVVLAGGFFWIVSIMIQIWKEIEKIKQAEKEIKGDRPDENS